MEENMEKLISLYNTEEYLKSLIPLPRNLIFRDENKSNYKLLIKKINYEIGVPIDSLKNVKSFGKLLKVCENQRRIPSELEEDTGRELLEYLNLKP